MGAEAILGSRQITIRRKEKHTNCAHEVISNVPQRKKKDRLSLAHSSAGLINKTREV